MDPSRRTPFFPFIRDVFAQIRPILLQRFDAPPERKYRHELVGEKDKRSQKAMIEVARAQLPKFTIVSEELDCLWPPQNGDFILFDPLDGTHNEAMGLVRSARC